jgi:hypothetical protein
MRIHNVKEASYYDQHLNFAVAHVCTLVQSTPLPERAEHQVDSACHRNGRAVRMRVRYLCGGTHWGVGYDDTDGCGDAPGPDPRHS